MSGAGGTDVDVFDPKDEANEEAVTAVALGLDGVAAVLAVIKMAAERRSAVSVVGRHGVHGFLDQLHTLHGVIRFRFRGAFVTLRMCIRRPISHGLVDGLVDTRTGRSTQLHEVALGAAVAPHERN